MDVFKNYLVLDGPVKLIKLQAMHGANFFSAGPVIHMRINLGIYDEVFSNDIEGLYDKLITQLPSLYEHHCSPGVKGGFFMRVAEGTLLGHITEHVAIELQTMAGMDVGYGKTRSTLEQGVYNVCFRFFDEIAGAYAGKAALNIINSFLLNKDIDIVEIKQNLIQIRELRLLGPSTQAIVEEAEKRKIPHIRLDSYNLVQLGTGKYHKNIRATITSDTGFIGVETADNKYLTNFMLEEAGLPVLKTQCLNQADAVISFWKELEKPIVLKPAHGYLGKNISLNLNDPEAIKRAYDSVMAFEDEVLVQEFRPAFSYRLLVIDYKLSAASLLTPPSITGNGTDSVQVLIDKLNTDPDRNAGDKGKLSYVILDDITLGILSANALQVDSVLPEGSTLFLKHSGNMRLGGAATDVTEMVHPMNAFLAERAAKIIGLNVAGIDILSSDISVSMLDNNGVILEVNSAPDFRMHMKPSFNKARPVARDLVNMLFPSDKPTRIPLFSITGSKGKTLMAFMLNHCFSSEGLEVGLTSTEGLFISNRKLKKGDMTAPEDVALVLKDPAVECAVLETPLEGIIRYGLGYKYADFGIVLNLHDEHLGNDDMEFPEDIAYAKSVVAEEVLSSGYSVLNADYPLCVDMLQRLYSKPVLFTTQLAVNKSAQQHVLNGDLLISLEDSVIMVYANKKVYEILNVTEIPCTFNGLYKGMFDVVLAVTAVLTAFGIHPDSIKKHLKTFKTTYDKVPGRLNFFKGKGFSLMLDKADSILAYKAMNNYLQNFAQKKIGLLQIPLKCDKEELMEMSEIAAQAFDKIILFSHSISLNDEITNQFISGLNTAQDKKPEIILKDAFHDAIKGLSNYLHSDNFIVILAKETAQVECQLASLGIKL